MEMLINERRTRIELTPATSYQRLLVHRCSAYHRLTIENDPSSKSITVLATSDSRIPARRLADLVPPEMNTQPAFKIMRRSLHERRSKPHSQAGSVAGDDADSSDVEPSESGSLGGRSNTSKKHMTIEEREAAYNEARSRIFMDFEGKEKETDSSSSLSLDFEDSSSGADESESSSSFSRDKKDISTTPSTSRSLVPPINSNGFPSSRNSRAPSPSFTYATLYEPPPISYDPNAGPQPSQYMYQYPPQPSNPAFVSPPPFQYYPPYSYPPQNSSDPASPVTSPDIYSPVHYGNSYLWHPQTASAPNLTPQQQPNSPPYPQPPFMHQPMYSYPVPGYYTPQPNQPMSLPGPPVMYEAQRSMPTLYVPNSGNNITNNVNMNTPNRRNDNHQFNGGKGRGAPPPHPQPKQAAWSFGPGVGMGGVTFGANASGSPEAVGPRLSSMRRLSNNSNGNGRNWDESSSTASSSTSSSSRQTFTSTTSSTSQHPLPPRPDWAVGLKPDNTLHPRHHHDHHGAIRPNGTMPQQMSPRNPSKQRQPPVLHPTDFPPLSATDGTQKRAPLVAGAWTNQSPARSILSPPHQGNPLVYHPGPMVNGMAGNMANPGGSIQMPPQMMNMSSRLDDHDRGFERPPPKGAPELYNPKATAKRPVIMGVNGRQNSQDRVKTDVNGLADQLSAVSMDDSSAGRST